MLLLDAKMPTGSKNGIDDFYDAFDTSVGPTEGQYLLTALGCPGLRHVDYAIASTIDR